MGKIDVGENEFTINVSEVEGRIDYEKAMKEFGIENIEKEIRKLKNLPLMYRRGIVIGHRDFSQIVDAINNKKEFAVLTGVNPSGNLHLGNKLFIDQALFLQQCGAHVYIPISDDETYVFKKAASIEQAIQNAYEKVIPDLIACGFDSKKTHIFISTRTPKLYELAVKLSTKTTFSTIKAIFGFTNETNPGQIFYAVMQSAHILFPQLHEYGGPKPVVVPIGIDQDPYMRLVRDIAEKVGKLDKYSLKLEMVHVVLEVQKFRHVAEITALGKDIRFTAKEESADMYASFDKSFGNIQLQLARYHDKVKDHKARRYGAA